MEIHANFLIVVAMLALIAIGDYHTAAYVGLVVQAGFFLEQLITDEAHYTLDDDMLPVMPAPLVAIRQGLNRYSSVIVVAVMLLSMGAFALTRDFMYTVTLLLVLCPCSLELILVSLMMGSLVDESSPTAPLSKGGQTNPFMYAHPIRSIPHSNHRSRRIRPHRTRDGCRFTWARTTWSRV
nr:hypothetical protein [Veillonella denticariosi]